MMESIRFCRQGAASVICAAFELLAEVEQSDQSLLPDELVAEARRMRAVVDEWIDIVE